MSFSSASYIQSIKPVEIVDGTYYTFNAVATNMPEVVGEIDLSAGSYIVLFNYLIFNHGSANITQIIFTFNGNNYVGLNSDAIGSEAGSLIDYSASLANSCTFCINVPADTTYQLTANIIYTNGTSGPSIGIGPILSGEIPQHNYLSALKIA